MATDTEILEDIKHLYNKIDQCYRAKEDIQTQIEKERADIINLEIFIEADKDRVAANKKPRYDEASMKDNIVRLKNNITLFKQTMEKEDLTILKFKEMITVLQEDMKRPKEIIIDMTGK